MSTFLTSLPDMVEGDEQRAVKHLRTVVKLLEKENHSFSKDCADKVLYQNKQQVLIREDNERLRIKVNELSRPKVSVLAAMEETQANMHNTVDGYTAKIEIEERELELLEIAIQEVATKIDEYQQRMRGKVKPVEMTVAQLHDLGFNPVKEGSRTIFEGPNGEKYRSKNDVCKSLSYVADSKMKKKLEMLENRVQQTLQRFNESLVVNKLLRAEIDHLRKERISFDLVQARLEAQLNQKKAEIAQAIEATNVALETRNAANKKIAEATEQLTKCQAEFDAEWRNLDEEMDSEEKRRRQVKARMDAEAKNSRLTEDEDAEKAQLQELTAKYEASKADVERFENAFAKLQEATGLKDIDELVTTFLEAEEQNFKLFKFVNELNQEEERLAEQVHKMAVERNRMNDPGDEHAKKSMERRLEEQLAQTQAKGEELFELEEEEGSKVREVLKIIRRMYEELGCSRLINTNDSFQCGPNGNPIINEANVMLFLGVVEQRSTELILRFINSQATALDDAPQRDLRLGAPTPLGFGPATPIGASLVRVQPPKIETEDKSGDEMEEDGDEEDDARPMTQDELRNRMKKKLAGTSRPPPPL
mmetsp:Transcript_71404/g.163656  ORF Transcript_71404/g.163656 Transcript_71404/m.163656 type:complete len:591 (-) Transcript_71404:82-1854(-)